MKEIKFVNILRVSDAIIEKVRQWRNKEEIRKNMLNQNIITREEHLNWIENIKRKKNYKFWVVYINGIPIGSVYLHNIDHINLTSEWGFYIGDDTYKGKGLSKCILFKFLGMVFEEINYEILFTKVISNNIAALNIYKNFKFEIINDFLYNQKKYFLLKFAKKDWLKSKEMLKNEYVNVSKE